MRKIILLMLMVLLIPLAYADVKISGNSRIDADDKTYQQFQFVDFTDNIALSKGFIESATKFIGYRPIKVEFVRYCENISEWNANNPSFKVEYVNWTVRYTSNIYGDYGTPTNQSYIETHYGCPDETCNENNTEFGGALEDEITGWWDIFLNFFSSSHTIPSTIASNKVEFRLAHKDTLQIEMFTQYKDNISYVPFDSPCTFETRVPSWSCTGCEDKTYEELTQEIDESNIGSSYLQNSSLDLMSVISYNFTIWAIGIWIFRILVFVALIVMVILVIFYVYNKIKDASGEN